jgi:hypothetical protein
MKNLLEQSLKLRLNPINYNITKEWLIGFIEAEGHFSGKVGEQAAFHLSQHAADWNLIEAIAKIIGHGKINLQTRKDGRSQAVLSIYHKDVLRNVIIPICYDNFQSNKKILQLQEWIKMNFSDLTSAEEKNNKLINSEWLVGFVDGDGSFYPIIHKTKDYKCGYQVQAVFDIAQLDSEQKLLDEIGKQYFNGIHKWAKSGSTQHLRILKLSDHLKYVEPFFITNSIKSRKQLDFIIWQEIIRIIENKKHLTTEGINEIKELQNIQNEYRSKLLVEIQEKVNNKLL